MIPLEALAFEHEGYHDGEDRQGNHFLDDLELHERERTSVLDESDPVCRHLGAILEEGYDP